LVSNFFNLATLVGKKMEKIMKFQKKKATKKTCQKIDITNFKRKVNPNE
jgi:predicted nucleic-acid-binding Zn-ribbon protein